MCSLRDVRGSVWHGCGEAHALHGGQIEYVVAHEADLIQRTAFFLCQFGDSLGLVAYALKHQRNTELGGAHGNNRTFTAGDQRHCDSAFSHKAQAVSVQGVESLDCFAVFTVPETAVRQDAINIKRHQSNMTGALNRSGRGLGENQGFGRVRRGDFRFHCQITLAASRSCICRAPNSSPSWSTTRTWVSRLSFMSVAASTASVAGETVFG